MLLKLHGHNVLKCFNFNFVKIVGTGKLQKFYYTKFFCVAYMCVMINMAAYKIESCICDHHVYKDLWIGKEI